MSETEPKFKSAKFKCPHSHCSAIAQQKWFDQRSASNTVSGIVSHIYLDYRSSIADYEQSAIKGFINAFNNQLSGEYGKLMPSGFAISTCLPCKDVALWMNQELVYPASIAVAPPNDDLDDDIKELYLEASHIYSQSAKGATALLRLALQLLLKQIGKDGKNINKDIKELVADGLSPKIQHALDLLRVVGNNAVHPGQIDLNDNKDIALKLFHLLNFIAEELISKPKELESLYNDIIPDETKVHISERDGS